MVRSLLSVIICIGWLYLTECFYISFGRGQMGSVGRVKVNDNLALPVWPVVPGVVSLVLEKLGLKSLGQGFLKKVGGRVIPMSIDEVSPFLLLVHHRHSFAPFDPFRVVTNAVLPEGFSAHPHSGFDTLTYCLEGGLKHRDSEGLAMSYGDGDAQWMRAGRGTIHEEMWDVDKAPTKKERFQKIELFQIWLDLPPESKSVPPQTHLLEAAAIPTVHCGGGGGGGGPRSGTSGASLKVLTGRVGTTGGASGVVCAQGPGSARGIALTPMSVLHVRVPAGETTDLVVCCDAEDNRHGQVCSAFIYVAEGRLLDPQCDIDAPFGTSVVQQWPSCVVSRAEERPRVRLAAAEGGDDLSVLVLIGEAVADGRGAKSGPFVARDEAALGMIGRAFSRVNERGGFWAPSLSDSDWHAHVNKLQLQDLLREEMRLD